MAGVQQMQEQFVAPALRANSERSPPGTYRRSSSASLPKSGTCVATRLG